MAKTTSGLKRPLHPMPTAVRKRLNAEGLWALYKSRPAYQQNDYIRWISSAKLDATREKRITQMIDELRKGNVYMKMKWNPR